MTMIVRGLAALAILSVLPACEVAQGTTTVVRGVGTTAVGAGRVVVGTGRLVDRGVRAVVPGGE